MKRRFFTLAMIATLSSSMLFTSCIGSFGLSSKFLAWNQTIDNKFVNALVFFVLTPAYAVTLVADALVINSIEFWSGKNPMEAGLVKEVKGADGKVYTIETLADGYKVENEAGEEMSFVYDFQTDVWSSVMDGVDTKLVKVGDVDKAIVYLPNGMEKEVDLSGNGILAFEQYMNTTMFMAAK